ncbi:MAG: hypothetical protein EOM26_06395 [Alphaproteobacteria bacterium]|nr:hypothetical protein [Alphaproteobacteria bacterium]
MAFGYDKETHKITDPDRGAVLYSDGGYSSGHSKWKIRWRDEVIGFDALGTKTYGGERRNTPMGIHWFIASMQIPEPLKSDRSEIMQMIQESLKAHWKKTGFAGEVEVEFDPRLIR